MPKAAAIIILTAISCFILKAQDQTQTPASSTATGPASSASPQTSAQVQAPDSISSGTAEGLARKYFDAWNTGDKTAIESFPAFTIHNHGGHTVVGSGMLERVITTWRKSMPDLTFTIDDTVAQGNEVVMRVTLRGSYKELLFPEANYPQSPPRSIRATGILMFKFKDGKLQDIWQELDESAMKVQMGAQWKTRQELDAEKAGTSSKPKKYEEAEPAKP